VQRDVEHPKVEELATRNLPERMIDQSFQGSVIMEGCGLRRVDVQASTASSPSCGEDMTRSMASVAVIPPRT
jgi:hypothetical protein